MLTVRFLSVPLVYSCCLFVLPLRVRIRLKSLWTFATMFGVYAFLLGFVMVIRLLFVCSGLVDNRDLNYILGTGFDIQDGVIVHNVNILVAMHNAEDLIIGNGQTCCPVTAALVCMVSEVFKRGLSSFEGVGRKAVGSVGSRSGNHSKLHSHGKACSGVCEFGLQLEFERLEL